METQISKQPHGALLLGTIIGALLLGALTMVPRGAMAGDPHPEQFCQDANGQDTAVQFLGQSEVLNKTTFEGVPVTELSGITYDRERGVFYAQADRVGGGVPSRFFTIEVPIGAKELHNSSVTDVTTELRADGTAATGTNTDGEGIAYTGQDQFFFANEGRVGITTEVRQYALDGSLVATIPVPTRFLIAPAGQGTANLSLESMALSPSSSSLFTANETPLTGDGITAANEGRIRILRFEDSGSGFAAAEEFFYLMEPARTATVPLEVGVVDIVALSDTDLLVLERGFVAGQGNTVRVFQVSLAGAEDVSDEPTLNNPALTPLAKTLVVDLQFCPDGGATSPPGSTQPNPILDNFEGMTLGRNMPDGSRSLVLISDDNGGANQKTRVVALAIP